MTMKAKFPGTCSICRCRFAVATLIEWVRGRGATHANKTECAAAYSARMDAELAAKNAPAAPVIESAHAITALLAAASGRGLKTPKARFLAPDGQSELRLSLAGRSSKFPGAVQVKIGDEWIGRILPDGSVAGPMALRRDVLALLTTIANNPAEAAKAYGAFMGRCSFCNLQLTDEGSVEVGYGKVCAAKYGLPHQTKGTRVVREMAS